MRRWIAGVALAAAVAAGVWGYRQYSGRVAAQRLAEAAYRRAFHELIFNSEAIVARLDKLLVANTQPMLLKSLEEVRLHSYAAQSNLGQLPLQTAPLPDVHRYASKLNDVARTLSLKAQENRPIDDRDWQALRQLRDQSEVVARQLNELRELQQAGRLNWFSLHRLSQRDYDGDGKHPLLAGLTRMNAYFEQERQRGPGGPEQAQEQPKELLLHLPEVTREQAEEKARSFLADDLAPGSALRFIADVGGEWRSYRFEGTSSAGRALRIDVAKRGGFITWVLSDRRVDVARIDRERARQIVEAYLERKGFPDMAYSSYEPYDGQNVGVVSLVYKQGDTLVYPDQVKVRIALDDGEVLGFNANTYVKHHVPRRLPAPRLTAAQARARVSPRLQVTSIWPALIQDDLGREVLAYEVRGRIGDDRYQVFINAQDGTEEQIQRIRDKE